MNPSATIAGIRCQRNSLIKPRRALHGFMRRRGLQASIAPHPTLVNRLQEPGFELPERNTHSRRPHDQYQVNRRSQLALVMPEDLPHLSSKTIANNGVAHSSRRDHPETRTRDSGIFLRPNKALKQKNAAIDAASLLTNRLKIATPPQMLVRKETSICP